jgi:hypothetical protein
MPDPTTEQRRSILSIDLGASYTKLAWRPSWGVGDVFNAPSRSVEIDGEFHIPSIAVDLGEGRDRLFGTEAAGVNLGANGRTYRDWKSVLFDASPDPNALAEAKEIAEGFLRWIREKLAAHQSGYQLATAKLRICIPALKESAQGTDRLREAAKAAGWTNSMEVVAEPRANLIGLASSGKNVARIAGGSLNLRWDEMFSSLFVQAMQVPNQRRITPVPVHFAVIDIGAFTTDIAVCPIDGTGNVKINEGIQRSFKLGVSEIDGELANAIAKRGAARDQMKEVEFKIAKEIIYSGRSYDTVIGKMSVRLDHGSTDTHLARFAEQVVEICKECISGRPWYILTGGGFAIPLIRDRVKAALNELGMRSAQDSYFNDSDRLDLRLATALGGASLAFDREELASTSRRFAETPVPEALKSEPIKPESSETACSCGGKNKDCARCHGKGVFGSPEPPVSPNPVQLDVDVHDDESPHFDEGTDDPDETKVSDPQAVPRNVPQNQRIENVEKTDRKPPISIDDLCKRWNEAKALSEFTLDGWMGELVFGEKIARQEQRERFLEHWSAAGKAAWLRLLCLATCFGVRAQRTTIRTFWETRLKDVWRVFTPSTFSCESEEHDWRVLDEVFLEATHRQFRDLDASGEDAELWRRVFYDFRKLHQFVYRNQFPEVILELAEQRETTAGGLVNFLKSGVHPNGRWAGVLGQSMTSPLLFVIRELRRLDVIAPRSAPVCFYMNSPARNVATRLGWIKAEQGVAYGIEKLTEFSNICQDRMQSECAKLSPFYDLPLQWYDFNNW